MDHPTGGDVKCEDLFYGNLSLTRDQTSQKKEQKNGHAVSPIMMSSFVSLATSVLSKRHTATTTTKKKKKKRHTAIKRDR